MHGMAKVKASEAEKDKKKKEKDEKKREYVEGMKKIFKKRNDNEMDDEALNLMTDILVVHPDVYTLWNFRKEILLKYKEEKNEEDLTALVTSEMRLTETCLRSNPKSYSAWYHRLWLLNNLKKADLETELMICNKYLKLDSRNFHCWDYRREIVTKLGISHTEELNYTMVKIEEDFSNYSSWHYRSKLLPIVHEDPTGIRPIKEDVHLQELELVQNAAFTDPYDSSAWFYLRWLLGRLEPKITIINCYIKNNNVYITFNKRLISSDIITIKINQIEQNKIEKTPQLLIISLPEALSEVKINIKHNENNFEYILNETNNYRFFSKLQFEPDVSKNLLTVLTEQLNSCDQLLELEPESKWTLLTSVVLMQAIDKIKYKNDILNRINLLSKVDHYRSNYYFDTGSKILIENKLEEWEPCEKIDLSNMNLTGLYYTHYMSYVTQVDLSKNNLNDKSLPLLSFFKNCQYLSLSENNLTTLKGFPILEFLKSLNVSKNKFKTTHDIYDHLTKMKLENIEISENPCEEKK